MIELSIIIPSFNTKLLLQQCLKSIFKQTKEIDFEVIVVDNNSQDNSISMVKQNFPQVKLITNSKNLGYAKANNQGLKQVKGKYVLLLNSDTLILDRAIEKSLNFLKENNNIDILGCKLLNKDKSIQPSAGFSPNLFRVWAWMCFWDELPILKNMIKPYQQSNLNFYQREQRVDWVTGAFLLMQKNLLKKVSGFDERFFMYAEEIDLCFRLKQKGAQIYFYPQAKIVHLKGKSSADGFSQAVLGEYQGLKKFYQKHYTIFHLLVLRFLLKIGALLRVLIFAILKQDRKKRKIYEKAFKMA